MTDETPSVLRPRRSVLYMPAANERALEKARTIAADSIIFDLEDAVAPDTKDVARQRAVAAVTSGTYGTRELTIRCNGLGTQWGDDDLAAIAAAAPAAVVVPKVDSPETLDDVAARLDAGGASDTAIWAMVETPTAILDARRIAAHPLVDVLVMGTNDLAREIRAPLIPGRANLVPFLALAILAAREAGVAILDGVYNDVRDAEGFAAECRHGVELGFDGKTLIHPSQVELANEVFSPPPNEVDRARRIVEELRLAESQGKGAASVDGKMIDAASERMAQTVLEMADAIEASRRGRS